MKSAYKIAQDMFIGNVFASTSTIDPYAPIWKALWRAKVPNKVAIFRWRAVHNLIPTRAALTTKGYLGELHCVVYSAIVETMEHIFCACNIAKEILGAPPFSSPPTSSLNL